MVDINSPATTTSTTRLTTAPTVAAPGLTAAGVETCLGSAAGGISLMGGGFTFGSTRVDEGCTIRLLARQLYAFGLHQAALALMCEDPHVLTAMDEVGAPCPSRRQDVTGSIGSAAPLAAEAAPAPAAPVAPADVSAAPVAEVAAPAPLHLSFMPVAPNSLEERAWFDRASNMN
jgi:hypothetical protein